jgi:hypothetical protein
MFLSVNSKDRTSTSTSSNDCVVNLPYEIDAKCVELVSCVLPNTVYKIRAGVNDRLDFNDGANKTITITPGAYSITSLCSTILTLLNTSSSGFTACSYDTITMKVTITRSSNFSLLFSTGSNTSTSIRTELGFSAIDLSGTTTYTGQNVVNLYNPVGCYIQINELSMPNSTTGKCIYTFHVPMDVNSDGILSVQKNNIYAQKVYLTNQTRIGKLTIRLKNSDGSDFVLNNTDYELILKMN